MQNESKTQFMRQVCRLRAALNNGTTIGTQLNSVAQTIYVHRLKDVTNGIQLD